MIQNLIDEISCSTDESNISVLNSLCDAYEKAYTIVENCDESDIGQFSVIQESATDEEDSDSEGSKKPNILIRILKAIAAFFKTIVNSIKKLFNKDTDKVISQLEEVADLDEATAEAVQQVLDDPESKEHEKLQAVEEKHEEDTTESIEADEVDSDKEDKEEKGTAPINVKVKKMRTRIIFENWKRFLEESETWLEDVSSAIQKTNGKRDNVVTNRPTRSVKMMDRWRLDQKKVRSPLFPIKLWKKRYRLFMHFRHKRPIPMITKEANELKQLFKNVTEKADKASKTLYATCDIIHEDYRGGKFKYEPTRFGHVCDRIYKDMKVIRDETNAIYSITTKLAMYMGKELKMYGSLLDVIQPIIRRQKEANRVHLVIDKD